MIARPRVLVAKLRPLLIPCIYSGGLTGPASNVATLHDQVLSGSPLFGCGEIPHRFPPLLTRQRPFSPLLTQQGAWTARGTAQWLPAAVSRRLIFFDCFSNPGRFFLAADDIPQEDPEPRMLLDREPIDNALSVNSCGFDARGWLRCRYRLGPLAKPRGR